jgi:hypothetical protein
MESSSPSQQIEDSSTDDSATWSRAANQNARRQKPHGPFAPEVRDQDVREQLAQHDDQGHRHPGEAGR